MNHPEDLSPLLTTRIDIRWGEMDAYGHINNAMYLRYMEEARIRLLLKLGYKLDGHGQGPVIVNVSSTFMAPVEYPDQLSIDCFLSDAGRSSCMSHYKIHSNQKNQQCVCEGSAKIVWIDTESGKSIELPQTIRDVIDRQSLE